ncbi:MAG TPA: hypothetical protein PLZ51_05965, partial [Aggregatilineales bacterium]|nr:hypothetical protein [Aggregatilineales bacterium]
MAIDHIINYDCVPKRTLSTEGILERVKGEQRANTIIGLFRKNGDDRPPSQMGFEFTRSTPDGEEETIVVVVQDLLDAAQDLITVEHHCQNCPANRTKKRFGCMGFIQYPITAQAERWLIERLPVPDEPLIWLLLRQGIKEFDYDGETIRPLRDNEGIYFENPFVIQRKLGEFAIESNQLFEMIFSVGSVTPNHGALLLLFLNAIPREVEADDIMHIVPATPEKIAKYPFLYKPDSADDVTIRELKELLHSLYIAWTLDVKMILDV